LLRFRDARPPWCVLVAWCFFLLAGKCRQDRSGANSGRTECQCCFNWEVQAKWKESAAAERKLFAPFPDQALDLLLCFGSDIPSEEMQTSQWLAP
jgi:hypothetical protein